jgi:hypothetical protein
MHPMFSELFVETAPEAWWPRGPAAPRAPVPASPIGHGRQAPIVITPGPGQSATVREG